MHHLGHKQLQEDNNRLTGWLCYLMSELECQSFECPKDLYQWWENKKKLEEISKKEALAKLTAYERKLLGLEV